MSDNHGTLAGDTGEENIGFCGGMVSGFSAGDIHINLEVIDGPFHDSPDSIGTVPLIEITLWKNGSDGTGNDH